MPRLLVLTSLLLVLVMAPVANASSRQETMFQDDADTHSLVYGSPEEVSAEIARLKALGVDRLRITVSWGLVAPDVESSTRPNFEASDPNAYPAHAWDRYDTIVRDAAAVGMAVNFNVSTPAPKWARERAPSHAASPVEDERFGSAYKIKSNEFYSFMYALGRRYAGDWTDPSPPPGASAILPRVSYWSIWNEPNRFTWMAPQWKQVGRTWVPAAMVRYRAMVDAAWGALGRTGHRRDTFLVGELASTGVAGHARLSFLKPLSFVRGLYCLDRNYRTLRGRFARLNGCPASGSRTAIRRAHPGLFSLTGWSHHPYSFLSAPGITEPDPNSAVLADLGRLEQTLDRVFRSFGSRRRLGLYLTEYGYQTRPPDPYQLFTPAEQAIFLDQATWMTMRDPRVRALSQYLLRDAPPNRSKPQSSPVYWETFQTGLLYADGRPKPSLGAYRLPLWLRAPTVPRGGVLPVWGMVRPATGGRRVTVSVELKRTGETRFRTVRKLTFATPRGAFALTLRPSRSGAVRFAWRSRGRTFHSRTATFSVRSR